MNKVKSRKDDIRPEYDFTSMKGGVKGKYVDRIREGTNVVLLDPEVAAAFPTEEAVNEALRGVLATTRAVRRTGGLTNQALGSEPRVASKRRPRKPPRTARS
jgi:hypothetical protein